MSDIYSSSLAARLRLDYKCFDQSHFPGLYEVVPDFGVINGIEESSRYEIILSRELFFHFTQCNSKMIFSGYDVHVREVIDSLLMIHFLQKLIGHACIYPFYVPYLALAKVLHTPIEAFWATDLL